MLFQCNFLALTPRYRKGFVVARNVNNALLSDVSMLNHIEPIGKFCHAESWRRKSDQKTVRGVAMNRGNNIHRCESTQKSLKTKSLRLRSSETAVSRVVPKSRFITY